MVYEIKDKQKLQVETTLVNASSYRDLLSIVYLINSHLIYVVEDMSSILDRMKKCGRTDCAMSSSSDPPKKPGVTKVTFPIQALPIPPHSSESEGLVEKSSTLRPSNLCSFKESIKTSSIERRG